MSLGHNSYVGRTSSTSLRLKAKSDGQATTKSFSRGRSRTAVGLLSEHRRGRVNEVRRASSKSSASPGTGATDFQSGGAAIVDSSRKDNETILASRPNDGNENDHEDRADVQETEEVKFAVPERQHTAADFDLQQFLVDVEQLAASLQAVVRRQAVEDFKGDNLEELVSAVVTRMHNFKTFVSGVYDSLEAVRNRMNSATDVIRQKIVQPTTWNDLTFGGQSLSASLFVFIFYFFCD